MNPVRPFFLLTVLAVCAGCSGPATIAPPATPASAATPAVLASATPTAIPATPTDTPTPPPAPRAFTETFDSISPYWTVLGSDQEQAPAASDIQGGFLTLQLPGENQWIYAYYAVPDYADVSVQTVAQSQSGGNGATGVICRYDEQKGWYELNIFADQSYELLYGKWLAAGVPTYAPLFHGMSDAVKADGNTIRLDCQGNMLTAFINGKQQRRWQENRYGLQKGRIGLAAASFQDIPFVVAFDKVQVSGP